MNYYNNDYNDYNDEDYEMSERTETEFDKTISDDFDLVDWKTFLRFLYPTLTQK